MSTARFVVVGRLDRAGQPVRGTVLIDRATGQFSVRPHGSHRTYDLPLDVVATWVCQQTLASEVRDRKLAKKAAKK